MKGGKTKVVKGGLMGLQQQFGIWWETQIIGLKAINNFLPNVWRGFEPPRKEPGKPIWLLEYGGRIGWEEPLRKDTKGLQKFLFKRRKFFTKTRCGSIFIWQGSKLGFPKRGKKKWGVHAWGQFGEVGSGLGTR